MLKPIMFPWPTIESVDSAIEQNKIMFPLTTIQSVPDASK